MEQDKKLEYKGYTGSICYSTKDPIYFGTINGINDIVRYTGKTEEELEEDFRRAVDEYIKNPNKSNYEMIGEVEK